jgi:2,3-bisphosphoglycerate-independent phosphoglycerate mutase
MLMILDGWGHRPERRHNAIAQAATPYFDALRESYPHTLLKASGLNVGLPDGMMGNSEVGHLNLGAGRIVWQEVTRITRCIDSGEFFRNPVLTGAMTKAREAGTKLHLMGLTSNGGVHSYELHYFSLLEMAAHLGLDGRRVFFHAITDGRDTPPTSGRDYLDRLAARMEETGIGRIASVAGRYYPMDRDRRWPRVEKAHRAYTLGDGRRVADASKEVSRSYEEGTTDEFILPALVCEDGEPIGLVEEGDAVIFFNFRADRGREISRAFTDPDFRDFAREAFPCVHWVCLTEYAPDIRAAVAFEPHRIEGVFGEHLANLGKTQFRIAETEKYAHVTFFFNGGREKPFAGEDRVLVPSPKVPRYNEKPSMSAAEVRELFLSNYRTGAHDFYLLNFANPDMVGHTGDMEAAVQAVETVDREMKPIIERLRTDGIPVFITADHGNAELMFDEEIGEPHTAHTTSPVPLLLVDDRLRGKTLRPGGRLCDVLPTLAGVLGIPLPPEAEGENLLIP